MAPAEINWMAVLIGTVAYGVVGLWWYSPFGLGKLWLDAMGWKDRSQVPDNSYYVGWGGLFTTGLAASLGLSILIDWTAAVGWSEGALLGGTVVLAFLVPWGVVEIGFEERPILAVLVALPLQLLGITGVGALLGWMG